MTLAIPEHLLSHKGRDYSKKRVIRKLRFARAVGPGGPTNGLQLPKQIPRGSTPAQKLGLAFERELAGIFLVRFKTFCAPWLEYEDENGPGLAQPDFLLSLEGNRLGIVEAKLTFTSAAEFELTRLYRPLMEVVMPRATISCIAAFKHTPVSNIKTLGELQKFSDPFGIFHPGAWTNNEDNKGVL